MSEATPESSLLALEAECLRALGAVRQIHTMAARGEQPEPVGTATKALQESLGRVAELSKPADKIIVPHHVLERIDDDDAGAQGPMEWIAELEAAGESAQAFSARLSAALVKEAESFEALAAAVDAPAS